MEHGLAARKANALPLRYCISIQAVQLEGLSLLTVLTATWLTVELEAKLNKPAALVETLRPAHFPIRVSGLSAEAGALSPENHIPAAGPGEDVGAQLLDTQTLCTHLLPLLF